MRMIRKVQSRGGENAHLKVVWKFLAPGITGVHRDEDGAGRIEHEFGSFKEESRHSLVDGDLDALNLLCDHRQNLQLDSVELVEARPGARLRQTFEEFAHRLVVETVRTVEHHALKST